MRHAARQQKIAAGVRAPSPLNGLDGPLSGRIEGRGTIRNLGLYT